MGAPGMIIGSLVGGGLTALSAMSAARSQQNAMNQMNQQEQMAAQQAQMQQQQYNNMFQQEQQGIQSQMAAGMANFNQQMGAQDSRLNAVHPIPLNTNATGPGGDYSNPYSSRARLLGN